MMEVVWIGFNPLHCGAVVASEESWKSVDLTPRVSIPFIAGQWSLRRAARLGGELAEFQSPSLRGSGRFSAALRRQAPRSRFNPLHCGAVVASTTSSPASRPCWRFQAPSLRGSGRFGMGGNGMNDEIEFQSPSLRDSGRFSSPPRSPYGGRGRFQSPSLRGSGRFCSKSDRRTTTPREFQSHSLRGSGRFSSSWPLDGTGAQKFQSPSLRGSARFRARLVSAGVYFRVSIPFIAGQWSLLLAFDDLVRDRLEVSIPFIAGQWSLRVRLSTCPMCTRSRFNPLHCGAVVASTRRRPRTPRTATFQSPSLRGSGRFVSTATSSPPSPPWFQSPSLRGSGRFPPSPHGGGGQGGQVSIPFIAGQWSLRARQHREARH